MRRQLSISLAAGLGLVLLFSSLSTTSSETAASYSSYLPIVIQDHVAWIGPDGGLIVVIAVDPGSPQVMYAGSWGTGLFKSLDGGEHWSSSSQGLGNLFINSLAIDPQTPSTLYAGTYRDGVYKSVDSGRTWYRSGYGIQESAIVYAIAIDPLEPASIFIGTRGLSHDGSAPWSGIAYKSLDSGATWFPVLYDVGGRNEQDWVYSFDIHPVAHNTIFAATHQHGAYRSDDYGYTWRQINDGVNDWSGRAMLFDHTTSSPSIALMGVWYNDGLYKTLDGGNLWFQPSTGISFVKVYDMAYDPLTPTTFYMASFSHGVLRSVNDGDGWASIGLGEDLVYTVEVNPQNSDLLYAGTAGDGLYRSRDYGLTWQHSQAGIVNTPITGMLVDAADPHLLFSAVYGGGVMHSQDGGETWQELNEGLGDRYVHVLLRDPAHANLLYALTDTGGMYQNDLSTSNGWLPTGDNLPMAEDFKPAYPAGHPFASRETLLDEPMPGTPPRTGAPTVENLMSMAFAPSAPHIAYLGTGGSGVYKSYNGGLGWAPAGLQDKYIWSIAVNPQDANIVFAATNDATGLRYSLDGGGTWFAELLGGLTIQTLAIDPSNPEVVFAGTDNGLYTFQVGIGYTTLSLPGRSITTLAVDPDRPGLVVAGTAIGAFISRDGGATWVPGPAELIGFAIQALAFDPQNTNVVYFGTHTHGILRAIVH